MTSTAHELGATLGAWNAIVRRARIGRERKAGCLVVSSYARSNGTGIHCGAARLAVDLEVSYRTARRLLAWMREVGLIELVCKGNRRRGFSDQYRLIIGPNLLEDLDVPDPDHYAELCRAVAESNQGSSKVSPDEVLPPTGDQGSSLVSHENRDHRSNEARSQVTLGDPPSSTYIFQVDATFQSDDEELRTQVAVDAPRAVVREIRPGASQEAPYGPPPRKVSRAQQAIAEATARRARATAAHHARKETS